jgi:histone H3/H4
MGEETLVVVSKLKSYIKSSADMNTSGNVAPKISAMVRSLCDRAVENAKNDGRKTVMDRDFE